MPRPAVTKCALPLAAAQGWLAAEATLPDDVATTAAIGQTRRAVP
jgi:hypothetical protein